MAAAELERTFGVLTKSDSAAAAAILLLALDAPRADIRQGALTALLARRDKPFQLDLLARWDTADERFRSTITGHPGRLSAGLRQAIADPARGLFDAACDVILATNDYDLAPTLIAACEHGGTKVEKAGQVLLTLVDRLYEEWMAGDDREHDRNPLLLRNHALFALEKSIERYDSHQASAPVEALLAIADPTSDVLRNILTNPRRSAHRAVVDQLIRSRRPGVTRLLLGYLDESQAPPVIAHVLSCRDDLPFLRSLLRRVAGELSLAARANLKRIDNLRWLERRSDLLGQLGDAEQAALVQLIVGSGMHRLKALEALQLVLDCCGPQARRAASGALTDFQGAQANQVVLDHLADPDPIVQARLVGQLREKNIPTALSLLLERVDSPYPEVRRAVSESLAEFSFQRYLAAFDALSEEARKTTGALVRKIDATAIGALAEELASSSRTRKIRAIAISECLEAAGELLGPIAQLLVDDDPVVRQAADSALRRLKSAHQRVESPGLGTVWTGDGVFPGSLPQEAL